MKFVFNMVFVFKGSLPVSTTSSPESTTVMVNPTVDDGVQPAEDQDQVTNTESSVHPSSSSTQDASQSESVSESDPGGLLKNPA